MFDGAVLGAEGDDPRVGRPIERHLRLGDAAQAAGGAAGVGQHVDRADAQQVEPRRFGHRLRPGHGGQHGGQQLRQLASARSRARQAGELRLDRQLAEPAGRCVGSARPRSFSASARLSATWIATACTRWEAWRPSTAAARAGASSMTGGSAASADSSLMPRGADGFHRQQHQRLGAGQQHRRATPQLRHRAVHGAQAGDVDRGVGRRAQAADGKGTCHLVITNGTRSGRSVAGLSILSRHSSVSSPHAPGWSAPAGRSMHSVSSMNEVRPEGKARRGARSGWLVDPRVKRQGTLARP